MLPVDSHESAEALLPIASSLGGKSTESHITLIGVTPLPPESTLSEGALLAQRLRNDLGRILGEEDSISRRADSIVSHNPWGDIRNLLAEQGQENNLLLMLWHPSRSYLQTNLAQALREPPCDIAIVHPAVSPKLIKRILLPVRGGPFATLSLNLAVRLARASNAEITLLRAIPEDEDAASRALREEFSGLSDVIPEITGEVQVVGDSSTAILRALKDHQAVVLGASAAPGESPIGLVATLILQRSDVTTLIVKTKEPFQMPERATKREELPLLVQVEKWFAENTFNSHEFDDLARLVELKRKQGARISLGLPSLNDEATIGNIISTLKGRLIDGAPLLDEIVLIDGNSNDSTRKIAAELGAPPFVHMDILTRIGSFRGRGEAIWKGLYLLKGDIILWIDTTVIKPLPEIICGVLGPLLTNPSIQYVKGFYNRAHPTLTSEERMTELLVRPILNLFFPRLSGIVQPLAGISGGRRAALERVPFFNGNTVEMALLIEMQERFGMKAIAQVNLNEVEFSGKRNRNPGKEAFAILQLLAHYLRERGAADSEIPIERTMKALRTEGGQLHLMEIDVHEQQRPPIIEISEYRGRHSPRLP